MLAAAALSIALSLSSPNADQFARYGREVLQQMRKEMYLPDSHLYAENATASGPGKPSFNWGAGVMLSALDAAAAYDEKYKPQLLEYAEAVQAYWNDAGPVPGYAASIHDEDPDRYYDDNEWMVLALHEAAAVLGIPTFATRADNALKYVLSGLDDKLGGGIYWREKDKSSKNTCSNAPGAVAILYDQEPTKDSEEFKTALSIYDWTYKNLHDTKTGLFWDNIRLDGKVDTALFSYNTALMIDANALISRISGSALYMERARLLERQSVEHWVKPDGTIADEAAFAHKLIESWLVRVQVAPGQLEANGVSVIAQKALIQLHDHIKDRNGHYPHRWDTPTPTPLTKWDLLSQASAARAYFLMALYLKTKETPLGR